MTTIVRAGVRLMGYVDDVEMYVSWQGQSGHRVALTAFVTTQFEDGAIPPEPLRTTRAIYADEGAPKPELRELLQAIVDACYEAGITPKQIKDGDLPATKKHLEDMRALAFSKLEVTKP